jgi:hypothetical protein
MEIKLFKEGKLIELYNLQILFHHLHILLDILNEFFNITAKMLFIIIIICKLIISIQNNQFFFSFITTDLHLNQLLYY